MIKKGIVLFVGLLLVLIFLLGVAGWSNIKDRHPGYQVDINHRGQAGELKIGFSAVPITPEIIDTWNDANGDAVFNPEDGDSYNDLNGNGEFDAVWIAGFGNRRAAQGIHDDLWARTMVIEQGGFKLALVVVDAIGFMHDDVVRVRKQLQGIAQVDYCVVMNTHVHEGPDLIGLWGPGDYTSGVDPEYKQLVIDGAAKSVQEAVDALEDAFIVVGVDQNGAEGLVMDSRDPQVLDAGLRSLQAISRKDSSTLGVLVSWANHPETVWDENLQITSDFPHFIRESVENGIRRGDSSIKEGLGGICIYANGAVGGLMTTSPSFPVRDPFDDVSYKEPSFEKARAQGESLGFLVLKSLEAPANRVESAALNVKATTLDLPMDNPLFRLGGVLGILDRGFTSLWNVRSEISAWSLGPISAIHLPGEIYPEIVNGGIESPEGADYNIDPVEVPALRDQMKGEIKLVFGLSNDLVGYIIPKSEWDEEAPYLYGSDDSPYGEVNSLGPETAPILHKRLSELLKD